MAEEFAGMACRIAGPSYVRLDRGILPQIYRKDQDFSRGFSVLRSGKDLWLIGTGNMVHRALEVADDLKGHAIDAGVIDLFRLKPIESKPLLETIGQAAGLVTLEEHVLAGGLGGILSEILADGDKLIPLRRVGIRDKYYYAYGGRENIQELCGLDKESVVKTILEWKRTPSYRPARVSAAAVV
jgi:transketolase